MVSAEYSISASEENELIKWLELEIDSRFFTAKTHEMAVDCLRIYKLRFPGAEDPVNEASKDTTYDAVINSRARIFGAVSKAEIRCLLHKD